MKIVIISADGFGNKLFLKDLRQDNNRIFIKYRSTYNDIPFVETELFSADFTTLPAVRAINSNQH